MNNRHYRTVIAMGAMLALMLAASSISAAAEGVVAYFYTQPDSAAPVGVTIEGKTTVTVDPVAPGQISDPVALPEGHPDPLYSAFSPDQLKALQKTMKDAGIALPQLIDISLHAAGGDTKLNLPLHLEALSAGHVRALIYFIRVKSAGAPPEPEDEATIAITAADFKAAAGGKSLISIMNETQTKGLTLDSGHFDVWYHNPDVNWDEQSNTGVSLLGVDALKPAHYDLLSIAGDTLPLKMLKTLKPIASITPSMLPAGKIGIYLIRKPGKLEHVMDLTPK